MKKIVAFTMVTLFFITGIAYAKDYEVRKKAGEYDVLVRIDKNPPVAGENKLAIEISDSAGRKVADAKVSVDYVMPAMPGMPAMKYKADAEMKGSEYKAVMDLSMAGSWNITVKITRAGKVSTMRFTVDAR